MASHSSYASFLSFVCSHVFCLWFNLSRPFHSVRWIFLLQRLPDARSVGDSQDGGTGLSWAPPTSEFDAQDARIYHFLFKKQEKKTASNLNNKSFSLPPPAFFV